MIRLKIKVNNIYDHGYSIIYYDYTETTVNVVPVKDNSQSIALESNGAWSRVDANGNHVAAGNIDIHSFMWMLGESDSILSPWVSDKYAENERVLVDMFRTEFAGRDCEGQIVFVDGGIAQHKTNMLSPQGVLNNITTNG